MCTPDSIYDVTLELTASTSVQEFSKIFEGLEALQGARKVVFRIEPVRRRGVARAVRLSIRHRAGAERLVGIDIDDNPSIADEHLLRSVGIYLKRSYRAQALASLQQELAHKVQPFGLNNPAIRCATALRVLSARLHTGRPARDLARDARQLLALPPPHAFEVPPETPAEPLVLFQTRLWPETTLDPDRHEINEERALLIRTLRAAFGKRFLGGAVPNDFVRQHYPDLITPLPFSMRTYPRLLKRPMIAIYSRGLRDSVGFKMSEYLAASRCIVGHTPTARLPEPLLAGKHFVPFETTEECVTRCDEMLSRPADALAMRHRNWEYYREHVAPAAHLWSVIERAFQTG